MSYLGTPVKNKLRGNMYQSEALSSSLLSFKCYRVLVRRQEEVRDNLMCFNRNKMDLDWL